MLRRMRIILVSLILVALTACELPDVSALWSRETDAVVIADPRREYFRGQFDLCVYSASSTTMPAEEVYSRCNEFVTGIEASGWYEQPTEGFEYVESVE